MEVKEKNQKGKVIIGVALLLLLVMTIIGVTYAAFTFSKVGTTENAITTGAVTMIYTEGNNQITINNAMPMTEEVGKALSDENYVFDFTVDIKTGPKMPISYEVTAVKDASSTLENDDVRLYLQKSLDGMNYDNEVLEPSPYIPLEKDDEFGAKAGEMSMDVGTVSEKVIYYYRLRMWVDSSYELSSVSKSFTVKVNVYGKDGVYSNVEEDTSEANPPELIGDMIAVVYDEQADSWKKAEPVVNKWYNYDQQMWANAVTIKDSTKRATYKSAAVGTPIPIEDINTFMVWVPRYSYTLGNTYGYQIEGASTPSQATPGAFDIKFVGKSTTEMGSGQYTGDTPENYFTPSSFCWGDTCDDEATRKDSTNKELSGIWVGKFELTGTIENVSTIPNEKPLTRNNNAISKGVMAKFFTGIQNEMNGTNGLTKYGFSGNYDTHMIKNTEWGAFTYLSQSKYGKYGNKKYNGLEKEVTVNNCYIRTSSITGIGGDTVSAGPSTETCTTNTYETEKGQAASTTGNIYGIYDTSGGSLEFVMGNYNNYSGGSTSYNSGFSGPNKDGTTTTGEPFPSKRYYNLYTGSSNIKGDAMFPEIENFYNDNTYPIDSFRIWAARGGSAEDNRSVFIGDTGPFYCGSGNGAYSNGDSTFDSTRFVLIPAK